MKTVLSLLFLAAAPAFAAPASPQDEAMLIFVRTPGGKLLPVGALKTDTARLIKDIVEVREPGSGKSAWLWLSGRSLDDRRTLGDSAVQGGAVLDLSDKAPAAEFKVTVRTLTGASAVLTARPSTTVLELKEAFQKAKGLEAGRQRLIFNGVMLLDERSLSDYAIGDGALVHLVIKTPG